MRSFRQFSATALVIAWCFLPCSQPAAAAEAGVTAAAARPGPDNPRRFTIRDVRGKILAWEPLSAHWQEVSSGTKLWENSLVQVGARGTFSFDIDGLGQEAGMQADNVEVTLASPIVVRLESDIMRKVRLSTYFIPKVPPQKAKETDTAALLFTSITEAWERFSAMMVSQGIDMSWLKPIDPAPEASVAVRSRPIRILTPPDGFTAIVDKLPSEIRVTWAPVADEAPQYELRVWPADKPRPEAAKALTHLDFHNVRLAREGSFLLQVTTSDGKWQSKIHRLFVALPLLGRMTRNPLPIGIAALPIPLSLPPRNFTYRAAEFPAWVTFQWDMMAPVDPQQTFEVVVATTDDKPLLRKKVRERAFQLKFNQPGEYHWWVEAELPALSGEPDTRHIASEVRSFRLLAPTADPLGEMLMARKSGVLYLEEAN